MVKKILLVCCIALLTTSCASTKVMNTWKDNSQPEKFKTIFVFGLVKKSAYRSLLERQLVNLLKDVGVDAHTTYDLFPNVGSIDKVAAAAVIKAKGGDAVMVVRIIDGKKETIDLHGRAIWVGGGATYANGGWYSYYEVVSTPGFVLEKKMALVESSIFNVEKEKRVWSAMTKTTEESITSAIYSYSKAISQPLQSSGLF